MKHQEEVRKFFKSRAKAEGISLRDWCKKNGIIYASFFGSEDEELPGKVYLSQLDGSLGVQRSQDSTEDEEDTTRPDNDCV